MPVERHVANVTCEIPLPPPGRAEVRVECPDGESFSLSRPVVNGLPFVGVSYRALFSILSTSNVVALLGLLLVETSVCLLSKHVSLFTPVSHALLSLLFPLQWQGAYVPVLPFASMEILDAPVP